jgi:Zn-dependent protease
VWGVLNWIPIVPLDGGHMMQHFIAIFNEERAPLIAQIVTWVAVSVLVPLAVVNGFIFGAAIVVIFAVAGLREYRQGVARTSTPQATAIDPADAHPAEPPPPPEPPPAFPI